MPDQVKPPEEAEMESLYTETKEPTEEPAKTIDQEEQSPSETAVVPVKVLTGSSGVSPKVGDTITIKVVKVYGDEAEISVSSGGPEGMSAEEEIDEMDVAEV